MIKNTDRLTDNGFARSSNKVIGLVFALALFNVSSLSAQDAPPAQGAAAFDTLDANGDGKLSFDEFSVRERTIIDRLDSDENGVLTLDEFLNARPPRPGVRDPKNPSMRPAQRGERAPQPSVEKQTQKEGDRKPRAEKMAERRAMMQQKIEARFIAADTNGDQLVTAAEWMEANFLALDADNNGALTKAEFATRGDSRDGAHKQR